MKRIGNAKRIFDCVPNFHTGVASVLTPRKRSKQIRDIVMSIKQNDGLREDWIALGGDFRTALDKFQTEMSWRRK